MIAGGFALLRGTLLKGGGGLAGLLARRPGRAAKAPA